MNRRVFAELVGGPHALSVWTWLAPLPLLVALQLFTPGLWNDGNGWIYVLAAVMGQLLVAVAMLVPRFTYLRSKGRGPRPVAALVTFTALGAVRVLGIVATESTFGVPPSRPLGPELVIGSVQGAVVLALVAVWVAARRKARASRQRMLDLQARIRQAADRDQMGIDELLRDLLHEVAIEVAEQVQPHIDNERDQQAALAIRNVAANFVRPLSHRLAQQTLDLDAFDRGDAIAPGIKPLGRVREFARHLQPGSPLVATVIMLVVASGTLTRVFGPALMLLTVVTAAPVLYWGSTLAAYLMRRAVGHPVLQLTLLLVGTLMVAAASVLANALAWLLVTGDVVWFTDTVFTFTFISVITALVATAIHVDRIRRTQLATTLTREALALERSSAQLEGLRMTMSNYLHSSVQSELIATALALQDARGPSADPQHALAAAFDRMADDIDGLVSPPTFTPRQQVTSHLEFWASATTLSYSVDPACWTWLDRNPHALEKLLPIISEGLVNAVRHGQAGDIELRLARIDDGISVDITNPGYLAASAAKTVGLGLARIESSSRASTLTCGHDKVTLHVLI